MGERQYAVLEGTGSPFACVYPKDGQWVVRFRYGPRNCTGVPVQGVGLLKRMVVHWAEANVTGCERTSRRRPPPDDLAHTSTM